MKRGIPVILIQLPTNGFLEKCFISLRTRLLNVSEKKVRKTQIAIGVLLAFLPFMIFQIFLGDKYLITIKGGSLIGTIVVCFLVGVIIAINGGINYWAYSHTKKLKFNEKQIASKLGNKNFKNVLGDLFAWLTIFICVFPSDIQKATNNIFTNKHVVSYLIGPAMNYAFGDSLIPGLDYFSQYSLGIGPVFAPLLSDTILNTYTNYVLFALIFIIIFYGFLYHSLQRFFNSRIFPFH